jgi:hypothetical protein
MPAPDARSSGPATGLQTPVLLILFNRPELTARVFSEIAAQRPATLFVAGDGPRNAADVDRCHEARRVIERVGWPCDVRTNFAVRNLGAGLGPATALDWVFSQVDEAIILEDDCVPAPSFFAFAEALLHRYRHDPRVMEIGGGNYQFGRRHTPYSYYFSHYAHTNGWATWRRAWDRFDLQIARWPEYRAARLVDAVCDNPRRAALLDVHLRQDCGGPLHLLLGLPVDAGVLGPRWARGGPGGEPGEQPRVRTGRHSHQKLVHPGRHAHG